MSTPVLILAQRYNQIQSKITKILGLPTELEPTVGYNQDTKSTTVFSNTSKITAKDYTDLNDDLSRVRYHQVGSAFGGIAPPVPTTANREKVFESYIQNLESLIQSIEADIETVSSSQLSIENLKNTAGSNISSSLNQEWKRSILYTFDVEFSTVTHYRSFFNTGGEVRILTTSDYAGSESKSVEWKNALNNLSTIRFTKNQTIAANGNFIGSTGAKDLTDNSVTVLDISTFPAPYTSNKITLTATKIDGKIIRFIIELIDPVSQELPETVKGQITTNVSIVRANGTLSKVVVPAPVGNNVENYTPSFIDVVYEIIGGGGGGGAGRDDDGGAGFGLFATSGGNSLILVNDETVVTASGGSGGFSFAFPNSDPRGAGEDSVYGPGGPRVEQQQFGIDAPLTSYGAGGGGGGGDAAQIFDSGGNRGEGGYAGTFLTGTLKVLPGLEMSVIVGTNGIGHKVGYQGANGAPGYAKLTIEGVEYEFTGNGTIVVQ